MGDEMGMNVVLIILGLAAAGCGLTSRSPWLAMASPLGWLAFLIGVVRIMVPDFF
jgi:hypothetical protein